jgi:hypothetical protein
VSAQVLAAALDYATIYGWVVFPACAAVKNSHKCAERSNGAKWGATSDPAEIRKDFTRWPNARIGIRTGIINKTVVVETDTMAGHSVDGAASLAQLEAKHGSLPDTLMACSPSGSLHRYFRHPGPGIKIKNTASELGGGIDVRGDGGMVIAPPSVNLDGRAYRWLNKLPLAPLPPWLIELTRYRRPTIRERATAAVNAYRLMQTIQQGGGSAYANAALKYELANIHGAAPGHWNAALNKAGFSLGQLVAVGLLDEAEVARLLFEAAAAWGNPNKDRDVIRHAMRAGLQHPRVRRP